MSCIKLVNIRFWISWKGSPVKLTLRPGQTLEFGERPPRPFGAPMGRIVFDLEGEQ